MDTAPVRAVPGGVSVRVRVIPGARVTELTVAGDGSLRLRVAAPAVEGRANTAVLAFLATRLGSGRGRASWWRGSGLVTRSSWSAVSRPRRRPPPSGSARPAEPARLSPG